MYYPPYWPEWFGLELLERQKAIEKQRISNIEREKKRQRLNELKQERQRQIELKMKK